MYSFLIQFLMFNFKRLFICGFFFKAIEYYLSVSFVLKTDVTEKDEVMFILNKFNYGF
jgi:hypothetical protein